MKRRRGGKLTSVGVGELRAAEEAQVARPGPDRLRVAEAESGVEVVGLEDLLAVAAVVAAAVVSAVHPNLQEAQTTIYIQGQKEEDSYKVFSKKVEEEKVERKEETMCQRDRRKRKKKGEQKIRCKNKVKIDRTEKKQNRIETR